MGLKKYLRMQKWRKHHACIIDEEWCGAFIGRRYCARHDERWDNGGDCPKKESYA